MDRSDDLRCCSEARLLGWLAETTCLVREEVGIASLWGYRAMLTIRGAQAAGFCDGVSRRNFLRVGGLAFGGLSLPQLLAAEAQAGRPSHKALILIYLCGGPPHQDMFDLKVDAPQEVRGPFQPIPTNVPGIEI
ncbi:MAG: hypothetical protein AB7O38_17910, partial [Pirellulaceae bacterium]